MGGLKMSDWGYLCNNDDFETITLAPDDRGGLSFKASLRDGREIEGRYKYMSDLAELANDPSFTGKIVFAPGDEGLMAALETTRRHLRGELH
jgi:hypothetical protein